MCSLLSLGVLVLLSMLYREKSTAIDFASKELAGVASIQAVDGLDRAIDHLSSGQVSDQERKRANEALEKYYRDEFLHSSHMLAIGAVAELPATVKTLLGTNLTPSSRQRVVSEGLKQVNELFREVGDRSNLILDPDLDSYYAMSLLVVVLPEQQNVFNELSNNQARESVALLSKHLDKQRTAVRTILRTSPQLEATREVIELQQHDSTLSQLIAGESPNSALAHASLHRASDAAATLLKNLLERRIALFQQERATAIAVSLAVWLIALVFSITFTRKIVKRTSAIALHLEQLQLKDISELNRAIVKLGEGDTTYPLEPDISKQLLFQESLKRDELGFIARSLNQLASQTELAMGSLIKAQQGVEESSARVQKSEQRFRSMIEGLGEGLVITDLEGRVQFANRKFRQMLSCSEQDIDGQPLDEILGTGVWFHYNTSDPEAAVVPTRSIEAEVVSPRARFHAELIFSPMEGYEGSVEGCICAIMDVTERRMFEDQLRHQALHDALTGLPNRALFTDRVTQAISRHEGTDQKFAIIFIDLDNFKVVNDSLGHAAGDVLLDTVARRLQQCVRGGDTVARLGGDEFTILLERLTSDEDVTMVLNRIQKFFSSPVKIGDQEVAVGGSLGVAYSSEVANDAGELLRFADIAMYQAKAMGKHRHVVFDEGMREQAEERLMLERELRAALQEGKLDVYFQPIVDSSNSRITEVEALARWNSPERGMIPPVRFIPIAEESGLINELGAYVLRRACQFGARCREAGQDIVVGVNLSASQLLDPNLISFVASVLGDTGLPSRCLKLEITESMVMEDPVTSIEKLKQLKVLGIQLAMDDFGTGYSSMAQLKQMPIDTLKIDREFVRKLQSSAEDQAIILAIINMAQALHLSVTCEGIETEDQAQILEGMGCQRLQGFLFDKPVAEEELWNRYIKANREAA